MEMRRSVSLKIAVLLPIMLTTWFFTSEIQGWFFEDQKHAPLLELRAARPGDPTPESSGISPKPPMATGRISGHRVEVHGNEIQIATSVDLQADLTVKGNDAVHFWRLRVFRVEDGTLQVDKPYLEQVFEMDPSGHMSPTFGESIQLPSGRYRVLVTLYRIPKNYDLAKLKDEEHAKGQRCLEAVSTVTIS